MPKTFFYQTMMLSAILSLLTLEFNMQMALFSKIYSSRNMSNNYFLFVKNVPFGVELPAIFFC